MFQVGVHGYPDVLGKETLGTLRQVWDMDMHATLKGTGSLTHCLRMRIMLLINPSVTMHPFYSVYKLVSPPHATISHEGMLTADLDDISSHPTNISPSAVRLFHDSLEPVRLSPPVNHSSTMIRKLEEENTSKQSIFNIKRKRKKPPR